MSAFGGGQPQAWADTVTVEPNVPTVLGVRDLCVVQRTGGQPLVHGVSFTLAAGACLGIVGEYLAKTYLEVKHRPIYIVAETEEDKK